MMHPGPPRHQRPPWSGSRPRVARRSSNCVVVRSASRPPRTGALSERSIRGGHKSHRPFVEDASSLASDPMRYCAQLCRGESGSHVQVAGASLAGNDHSLSSSTVTGCVAGLFGCSRAGTGSSLCGSVGDRSSMDETIHRSCRASHRERDRRLRHSAAAAPGRTARRGRTRGLVACQGAGVTHGTAGKGCLGAHCGSAARRYEGAGGAATFAASRPAPTHHARENNAHAIDREGCEGDRSMR